jgi:hypothetical protein
MNPFFVWLLGFGGAIFLSILIRVLYGHYLLRWGRTVESTIEQDMGPDPIQILGDPFPGWFHALSFIKRILWWFSIAGFLAWLVHFVS